MVVSRRLIIYLLLSSRLVDRQYTLQYIIILEAGRWPICFQVIMFNVYFLMRLGQLLLTTRLNRIRTATRDGDRAVGVNRTVAVEPRPSPSNPISQYQNVLLERNNSNTNINCSNKFDKHDSLYTQI